MYADKVYDPNLEHNCFNGHFPGLTKLDNGFPKVFKGICHSASQICGVQERVHVWIHKWRASCFINCCVDVIKPVFLQSNSPSKANSSVKALKARDC